MCPFDRHYLWSCGDCDGRGGHCHHEQRRFLVGCVGDPVRSVADCVSISLTATTLRALTMTQTLRRSLLAPSSLPRGSRAPPPPSRESVNSESPRRELALIHAFAARLMVDLSTLVVRLAPLVVLDLLPTADPTAAPRLSTSTMTTRAFPPSTPALEPPPTTQVDLLLWPR